MSHDASNALERCIAITPSIEGWNGLNRLLPTIDLPRNQILVIDQGSRDGTEQKCRELGYGSIQMDTRASFAQAVNRGIKEALERKADYILVINNNVEFLTHVATQLVRRAESETNLGILAPRQIDVQDKKIYDIKRGSWHLTQLDFSYESEFVSGNPELIEADFCEFTCVLINSFVFKTVGFLDEEYPLYHADADFCFRCQVAGFRCAYDQTALIKHFRQKIEDKKKLIKRGKSLFAADHLKYHVRFSYTPQTTVTSWNTTNEFLWAYLNKYGLISCSHDDPEFSNISHPQMVDSDYLLTVWETTQIPHSWMLESLKFKHIFVPSLWNGEVFKNSGFTNVSGVPLGVEPDIFHPWGPRLSFPWSKSILCVFQNQYRKALDVTLEMWNQIRSKHLGIFLVVYGKGIECPQLNLNHCFSSIIGNFLVRIDWNQQIALLQPVFNEYVSHSDMAMLYRSCEIFLLNSRSEGFGFPVLEAMACNSVCVIPNYGATREFIQEGNCIFFEGTPVRANYIDRSFENVGDWWEPDLTDLCLKVEQAIDLDTHSAAAMGHLARQSVLSRFTWRHTMMALRKELEQLQAPSTHKVIRREKLVSKKYQKLTASLMDSVGHNFIQAGAIVELHGLKGLGSKFKSKIMRELAKAAQIKYFS